MGNVRTTPSKLTPQMDRKGYMRVTINRKGVKKQIRVHRLVALTFLPNPQNKPEVNHICGIKNDNRASQLEWCTSAENREHAVAIGLTQGKKIKPRNMQWKRVIDTSTGVIYENMAMAARANNTGRSLLRKKLTGDRKNNTYLILLEEKE